MAPAQDHASPRDQAVVELAVAFVGGVLALVRQAFTHVRDPLTLVRDPFALIGQPIALVGDPVALIRATLALVELSTPLLIVSGWLRWTPLGPPTFRGAGHDFSVVARTRIGTRNSIAPRCRRAIMLGVGMAYLPLGAASLAWLASALAFAVSMAGTPGPNNAMLTSSGSLWGFRRTVPHMLGISIGFPLMLVAVAAGVGGILRDHPTVLTVLRWLGAAYLLYLAWRIATAQPRGRSQPQANGDSTGEPPTADRGPAGEFQTADGDRTASTRSRGRPLGVIQAALFQWVNPKAWLVTISAVATVASAAGHPSLVRALGLAGVFLAVTPPITAFWTLVGVGVSRVLSSERALRGFNVGMAMLLVGSLVAVLVGIG